MHNEGRPGRQVTAFIRVEGVLERVASGRTVSAASMALLSFDRWPLPARNHVFCFRQGPLEFKMKEWIVQRIIDPFSQLSGQRLNVALFNERRGRFQIGGQNKGISCRRVYPVRYPGAAHRRIAIGVIADIMRYRDDQLSSLTRGSQKRL